MNNIQSLHATVLCLTLCGCTLKPLYENDPQHEMNGQQYPYQLSIKLTGDSTEAYIVSLLKNTLHQRKSIIEKHLNQDSVLQISMKTEIGSVGIAESGDAMRNQGRMHVHVTLKSKKDYKELIEPISCDAMTSFNLVGSDEFSNESANHAVMQRLITQISEKLIRDVIAHLRKEPSAIKQ
ncbi:MAG: hypothetical protein Q8K36_04780 [Alphaproteobacteria bacterium]|nr:hypothetical protein [Alphaproteobacteria bacterium]